MSAQLFREEGSKDPEANLVSKDEAANLVSKDEAANLVTSAGGAGFPEVPAPLGPR